MPYCPKCGKEVPSSSAFCPSCGFDLRASATLPAPSTRKGFGTSPLIAYAVLLLGVLVVFLSAVAYLVVGNATAGVIGIVFSVAAAVFGRRAYITTDMNEKATNGTIPMLIGLIIMIADGALLNFDIGVLLGGFLMAIGAILLSSGRRGPVS